jgi:hypothetical protein
LLIGRPVEKSLGLFVQKKAEPVIKEFGEKVKRAIEGKP